MLCIFNCSKFNSKLPNDLFGYDFVLFKYIIKFVKLLISSLKLLNEFPIWFVNNKIWAYVILCTYKRYSFSVVLKFELAQVWPYLYWKIFLFSKFSTFIYFSCLFVFFKFIKNSSVLTFLILCIHVSWNMLNIHTYFGYRRYNKISRNYYF